VQEEASGAGQSRGCGVCRRMHVVAGTCNALCTASLPNRSTHLARAARLVPIEPVRSAAAGCGAQGGGRQGSSGETGPEGGERTQWRGWPLKRLTTSSVAYASQQLSSSLGAIFQSASRVSSCAARLQSRSPAERRWLRMCACAEPEPGHRRRC
jgi:hypothetical protein